MSHLPAPTQIEHLYAISKTVTQSQEWKEALNEIARQVRSIFIFDNLVVYLNDPGRQSLEVSSKQAEAAIAEARAAQQAALFPRCPGWPRLMAWVNLSICAINRPSIIPARATCSSRAPRCRATSTWRASSVPPAVLGCGG